MTYTEVGWANDETHPLSQANMKTLDAGIVGVAGGEVAYTSRTDGDVTVTGVGDPPGTLLVSVTPTLSAARRYLITGFARYWIDGGAGTRWCRQGIEIGGGATTIGINTVPVVGQSTATAQGIYTVRHRYTPSSSGPLEVGLYAFRVVGDAGLRARGVSGRPIELLVQDIGPA